jgi:hypothetical protein
MIYVDLEKGAQSDSNAMAKKMMTSLDGKTGNRKTPSRTVEKYFPPLECQYAKI